MQQKLFDFFNLPPEGMRNPERMIPLLRAFLISIEIVSFIVLITLYFERSLFSLFFYINLFFVIILFGLHLALMRGWIRLVAWGLPILIVVSISLNLFTAGSFHDAISLAYPLVLIIAALTLGRRGNFFFTVLITSSVILLYHFEVTGLIQPKPSSFTVELVMVLGCFVVIFLLLQFTIEQIDLGYKAVESRAAELEQRVAERTAEIAKLNFDLEQENLNLRRAEEQTRLSEERYIALFEKSSTPAALTKLPEVHFVDVNQAFIDQYGYSHEDVVGKSSIEIGMVRPEDRANTEHLLNQHGSVRFKEQLLFTKSGEVRIGLLNVNKVLISGSEYVITTILDITERKHAEIALRQSEKQLSLIFNAASDMQILFKVEPGERFMVEAVNEAFLHFINNAFPGSVQNPAGMWRDEYLASLGISTDGLARDLPYYHEALQTRLPVNFEREFLIPSGNKTLDTTVIPVLDSDGNCTHLLWTSRNVTEQRAAEKARAQSEALYRLLVTHLPDRAVFLFDRDLRFILADGPEVDRLPIRGSLLQGKTLYEALPPDLVQAAEPFMRRALNGEKIHSEITYEGRQYEYFYAPLRNEQGQIHLAMILTVNITERRQFQNALAASNAHLAATLNAIPDLLFELNEEGVYISLQAHRTELLAVPPDQFVGRNVRDILPPAAVRVVFEAIQETKAKGSSLGKTIFLPLPIGDTWFELSVARKSDSASQKSSYIFLSRDVTERKRTEDALTASLHEKETLLREIHHRVKNNLQVISSLLYLQAQRVADPALTEILRESRDRIESISLVHEKLYNSTDLAQIPFGAYVSELAQFLFQSYGVDNRILKLALEADHTVLNINRAAPCGLILSEIISNAIKHAFPDGRKGTLRIALQADSNQQVHLSVSDDGVGMPSDLAARSATSLGLKLIERLTVQLQGTVERESSRNGTTYHIRFRNEE